MKQCLCYKSILILLLCLGQIVLLFAQNGTIKGRVNNGIENLPNTTVSLGNQSTLTTINGEFSLSIKAGNYHLVITHAGYQK